MNTVAAVQIKQVQYISIEAGEGRLETKNMELMEKTTNTKITDAATVYMA